MFQRITESVSKWLTSAAQKISGQVRLEEVIVSQVISGRLRFAQYVDPREGETAAMRNSYRSLVKEPTVKSCLDTIVGGVACGEPDVPPTSKSPLAKEVSEYCLQLLKDCEGGMIGITTATIGNGMIEGYSVCEPKWGIYQHGPWAGKVRLEALKPKPTDDYWLEVDKFWNVTGIRVRLTQDLYPPDDMVYWRHQHYSQSPHGTSLLRSCYRSAWLLDTSWKLRGIGLERYTLPVLLGKYSNNAVKASMTEAIRRLKATGYAMIPQEASVEPLQLAQRGTSDFEAAIKDLKEEICIAMLGGSLQTLQGFTPGGRGNSSVHQSVVDTRIWMYANALCELIQRQIFAPAVAASYGPDVPVPRPVLGGLNDEEVKKSLDLDEQLQRMGYPVSISGVSERTRRSPGVGDDILKAPSPGGEAGGGMGALGGLLGGGGGLGGPMGGPGGDQPPAKPPEPSTPTQPSTPTTPTAPTEPAQYSDRTPVVIVNVPREGYQSFAASDWVHSRGPRGGSVWTNSRTGRVVHQRDNPGGEGETPQEPEAQQRQAAAPEAAQTEATSARQGANDAAQRAQAAGDAAEAAAGEAPETRTRNRMRPMPEDWGRQLAPGIDTRLDENGNPIWNQTTSTGITRAQPIIDQVSNLIRNQETATDADVQKIIDDISNISGRDALYTIAVRLGVPGSMQPEVVARSASAVLNAFRPWGSVTSRPLVPAARQPRQARGAAAADATATAATPAVAAAPAPVAPEPPEPPRGPGHLSYVTGANKELSPEKDRAISREMAALLPNWAAIKEKHGTAKALLSMVGCPDWVKPGEIEIYGGQGKVAIRISATLPDSDVNVTIDRYIAKDSDGKVYIKNEYFGRSDIPTGFNGYYTWARFGYDIPINSLGHTTSQAAKAKFPEARTVQDIMKTAEGRDWWYENGSDMSPAKFELKPGTRSQKVLGAYNLVKAVKKKFPGAKTIAEIEAREGGKQWLDAQLSKLGITDFSDDAFKPGQRERDMQAAKAAGEEIEQPKIMPGLGNQIFSSAAASARDAGIDHFKTHAAGNGQSRKQAEERLRDRLRRERMTPQQREAEAAAARERERQADAERQAQRQREEARRNSPHWPSKGTVEPYHVPSAEIRNMTPVQRENWNKAVNREAANGNMRVQVGESFTGSDTGNRWEVTGVKVNPVTRELKVTAKNSRGEVEVADAATLVWMGYRPSRRVTGQ